MRVQKVLEHILNTEDMKNKNKNHPTGMQANENRMLSRK